MVRKSGGRRILIEVEFLEFVARLRHQHPRGLGQMCVEQGIDAPMRFAVSQGRRRQPRAGERE
ncbi:MAG: hypothetical protein IPF84_09535 [Proteobacteria bacterium]|nr:hypothetical protein [Pseudomonadota bacterium]